MLFDCILVMLSDDDSMRWTSERGYSFVGYCKREAWKKNVWNEERDRRGTRGDDGSEKGARENEEAS